FLPGSWRRGIEAVLGVPPAPPGEETEWRLQYLSYLTGDRDTDRWLIPAPALALAVGVVAVYVGERRGLRATGGRRRGWPLARRLSERQATAQGCRGGDGAEGLGGLWVRGRAPRAAGWGGGRRPRGPASTRGGGPGSVVQGCRGGWVGAGVVCPGGASTVSSAG